MILIIVTVGDEGDATMILVISIMVILVSHHPPRNLRSLHCGNPAAHIFPSKK